MQKILVLICLPIFLSSEYLLADSESEEEPTQQTGEWSRAIRGFRRDHNFAVSYGRVWNRWKGSLGQASEAAEESDSSPNFSFNDVGNLVRWDYSYHLPIWGALGQYLGTRIHLFSMSKSSNPAGGEFSFGLPGLSAGLVYNFTNHFRASLGAEFGWERIERLYVPGHTSSNRISVSGESLAWNLHLDYFYELSWALQFAYEVAKFSYAKSESLSVEKNTELWTLGLLKHLI